MGKYTNQRFTLTADHIRLIRRMNVRWNESICGAPEIDPKRPYGNSDHERDIAEILGWELVETREGKDLTTKQAEAAKAIHREMGTALAVVLAAGTFEPGVYVASDYSDDWRPL